MNGLKIRIEGEKSEVYDFLGLDTKNLVVAEEVKIKNKDFFITDVTHEGIPVPGKMRSTLILEERTSGS